MHQPNMSSQPQPFSLSSSSSSRMPDNLHLLPMKHIYRTTCDTFRVQVGKGVKGNPNGKFSRNIRNETDALWLCEIALLFIDCPPNLSEMLCNGNYKCLLQRNMVQNPNDYLITLTAMIEQMLSRGFLKPPEWERAMAALKNVQTASPVDASAPHQFLGSATSATLGVASSTMTSIINSRKKRRRHNIGDKSSSSMNSSSSSLSPLPSPLHEQSSSQELPSATVAETASADVPVSFPF